MPMLMIINIELGSNFIERTKIFSKKHLIIYYEQEEHTFNRFDYSKYIKCSKK